MEVITGISLSHIYHSSDISIFSFHSGRAICVLCRRAVWGDRGARNQRRETSEDLCAESWGNLKTFLYLKKTNQSHHQVDLRSIDHVYKNQFGKHLDKLVRRETQCCCLMLLLLSRSYCYCYCHCPGAGGDRWPLQKHIAGSSPPREDSLKKLWLGEEETLQKYDDEAHTVCLWLWQVWHTVCHTANWKQGPDVCNSSFSTFCILTLKLLTCQIGNCSFKQLLQQLTHIFRQVFELKMVECICWTSPLLNTDNKGLLANSARCKYNLGNLSRNLWRALRKGLPVMIERNLDKIF